MFNKVLINDDHDAILGNIVEILKELKVTSIDKSQYCDEAYLKLKKAALDDEMYDLLITDLSFKKDHRNIKLESGEDLIAKIRLEFPELKIIVYSMKDQLQKVRYLINNFNIQGYVCKDRKGSIELTEAIRVVSKNNRYLSPQVAKALSPKTHLEIDDFDIKLLELLSRGLAQDEISNNLRSNGISPNSLSTIEKKLNKLRIQFKANNAIHLVSISKDLGLI
ncbi:response regulator [Winogradskyella sp. PE311]|uniref:response regulator n=1 Tax=Winogradskyella sp. PE311 TaxID=3366943 RepID=UPI00397FB367